MKVAVSFSSLKFLFTFIHTSFKIKHYIKLICLLPKGNFCKIRVCSLFPQLSVRISILSYATSEDVFHANMYGNTRIYHILHEMQSFALKKKSTSLHILLL